MSIIRSITYPAVYLVMMFSVLNLAAQTPSREYQLKAVFLFNFTQFIDWPPGSFATAEDSLVIGILGENPFGTYLEEAIAGENVNGHPVTVQYYNSTEDIKTCHILFINIPEIKRRERVLAVLKGRHILTVGDSPDFSKQGGMIKFFTRDNRIKLQVNLEAAKEANLVFSSKLLRLAEIFGPNENN